MKKIALLTIKIPSPDSLSLEIMDKKPQEYLLSITTFFSLALLAAPAQTALAQTRALPRAGFNNYSTGGNPLPSGSGLRLQEGQDRPKGAPAGVYNPGEPTKDHKLVRWEARFMPLKVWISPGKKLIEEPISVINAQRMDEVWELLKNDSTLNSLPQCKGWEQEMNSAAKSGIEQWKEFQNEGLFSFVFVDDPSIANIFLFWTERFTGDEGAGGVSTGGNTVARLYPADMVHAEEAKQGRMLTMGTPVVMELQVKGDSYEQLQARVAHEFGHALGIKEHSPFNDDLMCVNGIAKVLSASDKATIRWLYHQKPENVQFVMYPHLLPRSTAPAADEQEQQRQANSDAGARTTGPGGGYRVHIARPIHTVEDTASDDNSSASKPAYNNPGNRQSSPDESTRPSPLNSEAGESKKPKERKSKHQKDSDESAPATTSVTPALDTTAQPPRSKASEGY